MPLVRMVHIEICLWNRGRGSTAKPFYKTQKKPLPPPPVLLTQDKFDPTGEGVNLRGQIGQQVANKATKLDNYPKKSGKKHLGPLLPHQKCAGLVIQKKIFLWLLILCVVFHNHMEFHAEKH